MGIESGISHKLFSRISYRKMVLLPVSGATKRYLECPVVVHQCHVIFRAGACSVSEIPPEIPVVWNWSQVPVFFAFSAACYNPFFGTGFFPVKGISWGESIPGADE
jgi:hypothetical protein